MESPYWYDRFASPLEEIDAIFNTKAPEII